ncbi:uncharacterized protein VP01_4740g1 [Puccinia sorghi]|uniref:Uncharacterized protein n=1 Tax=Puccinia sorghi TaxID=27349 RepID=A0A0L6UMV7_9BASI|nr:uncharacterized protein VP01_4740g1 [Puccinia sorghi]
MGIGDCQVWEMIDSGLMVNLLPKDLVHNTDLIWRQENIGLQGIRGHACQVDKVVESEWVEVAKCKRRISFLLVKVLEVNLGRLCLFVFQAELCYNTAWWEEILSVLDSRNVQFEKTIH